MGDRSSGNVGAVEEKLINRNPKSKKQFILTLKFLLKTAGFLTKILICQMDLYNACLVQETQFSQTLSKDFMFRRCKDTITQESLLHADSMFRAGYGGCR